MSINNQEVNTSYKEQFKSLCEEIELELAYNLGASPEELKVVEEYFKLKHDCEYAGGIAYKHGIKKLEKLKKRMMEVVR